MERRKYERARRRELLLGLLRFILLTALVVISYFTVRYVNLRSEGEIAAVRERAESDYYLIAETEEGEKVRMTVVDDQGKLSMEISGDEVSLTSDQKTAVFSGADATYYEDDQPSIVMHADRIEYDMQTEDFLLTGSLKVESIRDGMTVAAKSLIWRRAKDPSRAGKGIKVPAFSFPDGVSIVTRDGNTMRADYMQADKELRYMEFVGHVTGELVEFEDTEFISEREITDIEELKLEDFEKLAFNAEQVIYDKRNQVVLATSRFYDRAFKIIDLDGQEVKVEDFHEAPQPVKFSREEITIEANHLEAHIEKQWVVCTGDINMLIPPAESEEGDDRSLKVVKRFETRIATGKLEYFWGRDHIITHMPTRVEQEDRLALADRIVYWGARKQVLLDGSITVVQGSGRWLVDEELIEVDDHDMERAVTSYAELFADRAVIYLDNNDFIASGSVLARQDERETAADTIVYQDEIKRLTAQGNVKFRDKDRQTLLCGGLVFHNDSDFMEVRGGASASIRLPAKYANDINRTLAEVREQEPPAEITDPPVPELVPARNPNAASQLARGLTPMQPAVERPAVASGDPAATGLPALPLPGQNGAASGEAGEVRELTIQLGDEGEVRIVEDSGDEEGTDGEPQTEPEEESA